MFDPGPGFAQQWRIDLKLEEEDETKQIIFS